jgi:hypothetical protein
VEYDKQAVEHEQLAPAYRKHPAAAHPKGGPVVPQPNYPALAEHCDRLAKSLRDAAAEAREMAHLHHDVAKMAH